MPKFILPEEEPKLLGDLTPGASQQMAPMPPPVAPPVMAPPAMNQVPPLPRQAPAPVAAPSPQLPGMPPNVGLNDFEKYLNQNKQQINRFGPDDILAQQNQNDADRNSLSTRATSGLKGFADALMMGVAGAGNPGWQKDFENQKNLQASERMGALKDARGANIQGVESNMSLDKLNPGSELSKASQDTYAPLFEKLGYPADAISKMPAAGIENALTLMAQFGGKQVEAMIKKYEAEIAGSEFEETKRHNRAVEGNQAVGDKRAAAETILKGSKIPFVGPSHAQKVEATNYLAGQTTEHPQANEALEWAKNNPKDPRAAEILKRLNK